MNAWPAARKLMPMPADDRTRMPEMRARRLIAAADRLLPAWGHFAPDRRRRLAAIIVASAPEPESDSAGDVRAAARRGLDVAVSRWAAAVLRAEGLVATDAVRAGFLTIGGAQRWPDQLLAENPGAAFTQDLRRALPQPLPPAAPLDMPEQVL